MSKIIIFLLLLCMHYSARGQTQYEYRYWFDNDISTAVKGSTTSDAWQMEVDLSPLTENFHTIHLQVTDEKNISSAPVTRCFFLSREEGVLTDGIYWFDDESKARRVEGDIQGTITFDVTELQEGFHALHYQVLRADGLYSQIETRCFYKMQSDQIVGQLTFMCYIDGTLFKQERVSANNGEATWLLDVSDLPIGFHKLQVKSFMENGTSTSIREAFFLRNAMDSELNAFSCVFSIDGEPYKTVESGVRNGVFHCDLDVAELSDGLHKISYTMTDGKGAQTTVKSQYFIKTPVGGNSIKKYQYWVNDNDDMTHTVVQEKATDPLKLISLLPVEPQPLRSKLFHFDIKDGKPMMYAKNKIHLRFFDAADRFTDASDQYVDYQVGQEIVPVGELQVTQTFEKVTENDVRWYTIEASKGEYLEFKLDRAATIQLFSPSGEEIYCASGANVVKWGGCHAKENGIYYFALHDVTAQQGTTITLEYKLTSRYAVLHHTPDIVGNAKESYFTMHLNGNGFDKLVNASLKQGDYIICMDSLLSASSFKADIQFCIVSDHPVEGNYDLVLSFVDEDGEDSILIVKDAIIFEEAYYAGIKVEMVNKSNIRPYPLSVKLKNEGNMPYSLIPLNIAWDNPQQANDVIFKNFYATVAEVNDSAGYQPIVYTNNLLGKGIDGVVMFFFIPELGPYETMELQLGFSAPGRSHFNIYAWTGTPLELDTLTLNAQPERGRRRANTSNVGSNILSFGDNLQIVTGSRVMPNTVQYAGHVSNNTIKIGATIGSMQNAMGRNLGRAQIEALGGDWEDYKDIYEGLYPEVLTPGQIIGVDAGNCVGQLMNNQRECATNPNPTPNSPHHGYIHVPVDPNDIFGYLSDAGSKFIADSVASVNYTIEFENDTMLATAAAHMVVIKDTIDSQYFDLTKFMPTGIRIGSREIFLNEADVLTNNDKATFIKTIDMRPEINAIAQVEGTYCQNTGIAEWRFTSLDPMTMEPTDDLMQGILPVNYDGTSGIGEVMYEIGLKPNKADGTEISNRASIVFDYEEAILTPTWTNIVDATDPVSHVKDVHLLNDSIASVCIEATDELSGPWRYDVYIQYGEGSAWWKAAENIPVDSIAHVKIYEGIDHGFYVVATDSAGNVEQKQAAREFTLDVFGLQEETNTQIDLAQGWNWMSHNQQTALQVDTLKSASIRMVGQTEELIDDAKYGWMGDLTQLLPTQMYKVQVKNPKTIQLSGRLFSSIYRSIPLYQGWNWIGYPMANTMSPAEAFLKLEAEEGDMLIGQDGLATYNSGQWLGTLMEMVPGLGYMYFSASDKNLFYNATAQASARRVDQARVKPEDNGWVVDKRKYPNIMGMIAMLIQKNTAINSNDWILGAFCGDECRGISTTVGDILMMNVYGQGGEPIVFYAMNRETGEVLLVTESEQFQTNVLGTMQQPYLLHIGETTGISDVSPSIKNSDGFYDLQGRKVESSQAKKGIYVVTDKKHCKTQKMIRR